MGINGGAEAAVHAIREYAQLVSQRNDLKDYVVVKLDMKNAFNEVLRQQVLQEIHKRCPEIYKLVWQSYRKETPLFIGDTHISSETGVQQGDPLGSLCFTLAIDPIIQSLKS